MAINVRISAGERAAFVGKTGSGKSYLARHFLRGISRFVLYDGKGDLDPNEWGVQPASTGSLRALRRGESARIYVPPQTDGNWDDWNTTVYEAGNTLLYIDEMYTVVEPGRRPSPPLNALYTRGRSRGIGVWAATQRPSWVPLIMFSEAEWFFIFRLTMADDRKKVAGFTSPEVEDIVRDRHGFHTYNVEWDTARYSRRFVPGPAAGAGAMRPIPFPQRKAL